jgi:hypothetical protein
MLRPYWACLSLPFVDYCDKDYCVTVSHPNVFAFDFAPQGDLSSIIYCRGAAITIRLVTPGLKPGATDVAPILGLLLCRSLIIVTKIIVSPSHTRMYLPSISRHKEICPRLFIVVARQSPSVLLPRVETRGY